MKALSASPSRLPRQISRNKPPQQIRPSSLQPAAHLTPRSGGPAFHGYQQHTAVDEGERRGHHQHTAAHARGRVDHTSQRAAAEQRQLLADREAAGKCPDGTKVPERNIGIVIFSRKLTAITAPSKPIPWDKNRDRTAGRTPSALQPHRRREDLPALVVQDNDRSLLGTCDVHGFVLAISSARVFAWSSLLQSRPTGSSILYHRQSQRETLAKNSYWRQFPQFILFRMRTFERRVRVTFQ